MKLLFISYDGLTDPLGQSQIIPYVIGLKKRGLNYSIFSVEKESNFKENKRDIQEQLSSLEIPWNYISYTKKPALLSSFYDILRIRQGVNKKILKHGITHLHCRSYVAMYAVFPLVKKYNLKVIFDMRGFWIDERIEGGIWNRSNPVISALVRYLKRCEKKWFEKADLVISLTQNGKKAITKLYPQVQEGKIDVIPCCADESLFNPSLIKNEDGANLKNQLGINKGQRILAYVGSIGTWYLSNEMMQTFKYLKNNDIVDKFLIVTRENPTIVEEIAEQNSVKKADIIIKSANRNEVPNLLNIIDLGLFYIRPSFSKIASSPTKLGEYLLMGKSVICNKDIGDLNDFFKINNVGLCIDLNSIEKINPNDCKEIMKKEGLEIRKTGLEEFGLKSGIEKYYQALCKL